MPLADLQALLGFAEIAFSEGVLPELSGRFARRIMTCC